MDVERLKLAATGELGATIEIKTQLLARLEAGRGAYLDARDVDEPSLALIQTIEAAAAAFAERTLPFGLIEPSDRLCAAYETVGLFAQLMSRIAPDS
ncbi:MAG: hypothetical protein ACKOEE_15030 [Tagaea sp.]|jgi:hypothetical protein|nr:hypothetical protein [Azospirillum sp.]MCA3266711.1 hypothetical protein [Azospirillum sp.]MCZ8124024.1 hypothetical protein [Magnetospirillum sp.]